MTVLKQAIGLFNPRANLIRGARRSIWRDQTKSPLSMVISNRVATLLHSGAMLSRIRDPH
jgi:hypothetical protein